MHLLVLYGIVYVISSAVKPRERKMLEGAQDSKVMLAIFLQNPDPSALWVSPERRFGSDDTGVWCDCDLCP